MTFHVEHIARPIKNNLNILVPNRLAIDTWFLLGICVSEYFFFLNSIVELYLMYFKNKLRNDL